jgi:hypothetical protein
MLGADPAPGGSVVHGGAGPQLLGEAGETGADPPHSLDLDATPLPRMPPPRDPDATPLPRRPPPRSAPRPSPSAAASPAAKPAAQGFWARLFGKPEN